MWRLTSIAIMAGGTALLAARQAKTPAQTGTESTPTAASVGTRTVTGCLRAGDQQNSFVLAVINDTSPRSTAQGDRSTSASPQATGTTGNTPKTVTYELVPQQSSVNLRRHVGERVEVTGRLAPSGTTLTEQTAEPAKPAPDARPKDNQTPVVATTSQAKVQLEQLNVTSIKAVGGSCQ